MAESQTPSTYNEPTVMWRMQRGKRLVAHAVITLTAGPGAVVVWFTNSHPIGVREFGDWADAIAWCDRLRDQNWTTGWRLTPDDNA